MKSLVTARCPVVDLCGQVRHPLHQYRRCRRGGNGGALFIKSEITRARIARARVLLRETRKTMDEIAKACGFATGSQFLRMFKQEEGVTPGTFRSVVR